MENSVDKDRSAFRTIGELSKELNIKPHILRYWEDQFAMLQPLKRAGARRHYRPEDVEMVRTINRLVNEEGYTIKGARKALISRNTASAQEISASVLENSGASEAIPMKTSADGDAAHIVSELKAVREKLSRALEQA